MALTLPPPDKNWVNMPGDPGNQMLGKPGSPTQPFAQYMALLNGAVSGGLIAPTPTRPGDLIYWNGSAWVSLAGNNSGTQFLQENSSGVPSWATPPSAMTLLNTLTASNSATLSDTTSLTSTYALYEIVFTNILPATFGVQLEFQVHSGGAFQSSSYLTSNLNTGSGSSTVANPTTFIPISAVGSVINTGAGLSGSIRISNPSQTSSPKNVWGSSAYNNSAIGQFCAIAGLWNGGNGAVDGFQALFSSGNITSGTIKIYGIT